MTSYLSQLTSYLGATPVVPAVPAAAAQRVLSQVDEAFEIQGSGLSEKKADNAAQAVFDESSEKKEAVPTYGYLAAFNLGTIKSLYGWATGAGSESSEKTPELEKQELSEPHQGIRSSIQKVVQAYQNYAASLHAEDAAELQLRNSKPTKEAFQACIKAAQVKEKQETAFIEAFESLERMIQDEQMISGEKSEASREAYKRVMSEMYEAFKAQGVTKEQFDAALRSIDL